MPLSKAQNLHPSPSSTVVPSLLSIYSEDFFHRRSARSSASGLPPLGGDCGDIPKWLAAEALRSILEQLPVLDVAALHGEAQLRRAMMLSYFGHGYVWGGKNAVDHLPSSVVVPWHAVAHQLDRPPVLSFASYALENRRRLDPNGPIPLGNIVLLQNFLAGLDEEWFILIHVNIEAKAAPTLRAIGSAQRAVSEDRPDELEHQLGVIAAAVQPDQSRYERERNICASILSFISSSAKPSVALALGPLVSERVK